MSGLAIAGLGLRLAGVEVLHDLSLTLEAGHLVALVGPNGAGKTSLIRAVAGLVATSGTILLDGAPLDGLSMRDRARRIAYLPQGHAVHWPLSARDVVALGRYPHGVNDPARMPGPDSAIVDGAMARTGTQHLAARAVQTLSGGEKARVMLARVLAVQAPLLLADEPTAALDPRHQIAIMQTLKDEATRGALVIAATHDIGLAARLADRVVLMEAGRIMAHGRPDEVLTERALAEVYGITAYVARHEGQPVIMPWGRSAS